MKMRFLIQNATTLSNCYLWLSRIPVDGTVEVVIRPAKSKRSLEQNDKLHAILQDIAAQKQWSGEYISVEDWKRLMIAAWLRATGSSPRMMPAVDGEGFDVLYRRSSELSVAECADLITYIESWAVGEGVRLSA